MLYVTPVREEKRKDLPAITPPELTLVAVPARADARDALIGSTWDSLPTGAKVAASKTMFSTP